VIQSFSNSPSGAQRRPILGTFMNTKTRAPAAAPSYGEVWPGQGGIVVDFVPSMGGKPGWYLILATDTKAAREDIAWGGRDHDEPGATDEWDGLANTIALANSKVDHPAAKWARGVVIDGHHDFYIPSRREMRLLWARVPEHVTPGWYWSSTQFSRNGAWYQGFGNGSQGNDDKSWEARCRLVRRFTIE
jgi:hypothetical protein